ncbi:MAG: PAS domain S-box protein [Anaerolineae bacterium]
MIAEQAIRDKYFAALKDYIDYQAEAPLMAAAELGRELVRANVPTEEIVEIHEEALRRLGRELPDLTLLETARLISTPLLELLMAYGLAFRERLEILLRAEVEIRRRNRELKLLNQVIAASAVEQDIESILDVVCRELARAFGVPQAAAALLNEEKTEAVVVAEYLAEGRPPARTKTIPVAGNPSFQYLLDRKVPLAVDDAQNDPRLAPIHALMRQRGTVSLLLLPLTIEGEVVGSLGLDATAPRSFSAEEVSLAWSVADQVSGVLARARLDQERRRLTTVIEQSAESVIITDVGGTILYVNPAFERVTGYSRAEAVGQNPRILKSGKHDPAFYEELWVTLVAGRVWRGRFVNRKKDGTLYTEEATISPIREPGGGIINYVAIKRDVTREVELEEQYLQAQKMEPVGRLAGGIAHDFNNLLTAINGFARLLKHELPEDNPGQEMVDKILKSGQRAADLVHQLLTFSRKQITEPRVLNLNICVSELDKMLRRIIGEDIQIETILSPDLGMIKVDPTQIEQVILNLVVNARDAMPDGGELTIETANVVLNQARITGYGPMQPAEYVLLAVSDTGVGMSRDVQARIFEPFFTTKEPGQGTGLGLATVFGIVRQNHGCIRVYSEEGLGTTFKIYLPRVRATESGPSVPSKTGMELPGGHETILLVEDDQGARELACYVLEDLGYTLLAAQSGSEGLQVAARHSGPIHLLLADVVMPGMNGKALADELARTRPNLKTLFISGYPDTVITYHGIIESGAAFLQKPFSPLALAQKVRAVLDE